MSDSLITSALRKDGLQFSDEGRYITKYKNQGIEYGNDEDTFFFSFPKAKGGTFALTSDIPTNYVDLTTEAQVISGYKQFDGGLSATFISCGDLNCGPNFSYQNNGGMVFFGNHFSDNSQPPELYMQISDAAGLNQYDVNKITRNVSSGAYTHNFPNKSGTFALLSDIPSNFVTTNTNQTIIGNKTFNNYITMTNDSNGHYSMLGSQELAICRNYEDQSRVDILYSHNGIGIYPFDIINGMTDRSLLFPTDFGGTIATREWVNNNINIEWLVVN